MASFFKHVGTTNGKKVIIVQRSLPSEEHMAAVIYSDIMPSKYHDDVMKLLESHEGQSAWEFKDILNRRMMSDGNNMLEAISNEGYLKKVAANNVLVTPNSKSSVRLDELNSLLQMAGKGEEAKNKLERLENSQGMRDPAKIASTDAFVSETVNINDLSGTPAAPAQAAPAVDQNMLMMEMLKTMQSIQSQLAEMKGESEPKKARGRPKASV
jgi:hypothetical protein